MRLAKPVVILVLSISLLLNVILLIKYRRGRAIMTVNDVRVTKSDMDGYLEQKYATLFKALQTKRLIIDQEAHQQNVVPTDQEVNQEFDRQREENWMFAKRVNDEPWNVPDVKSELKMRMEMENLRTKNVHVTDSEIDQEYEANKTLYDTPDKAHCEVAAVLDNQRIGDVGRLLARRDPPASPMVIMQEFPREVVFLGDNQRFTFLRPLHTDIDREVFTMTPKQVKVVQQVPEDMIRMGIRALVIRMDDIVPGHTANLKDAKTREKIRKVIALRRASPEAETMSTLWAKTKFDSEDPNDRNQIDRIFFPDQPTTKTTK